MWTAVAAFNPTFRKQLRYEIVAKRPYPKNDLLCVVTIASISPIYYLHFASVLPPFRQRITTISPDQHFQFLDVSDFVKRWLKYIILYKEYPFDKYKTHFLFATIFPSSYAIFTFIDNDFPFVCKFQFKDICFKLVVSGKGLDCFFVCLLNSISPSRREVFKRV